MAEIYSLVYKPKDENAADHYTRLPSESVRLVIGQGIEGDLNGSGNPNRQLNIMSYETQIGLGAEGFKARPGELNFASSGNGQSTHLSAELFAAMAGVKMNHIPYKGSAPALTDTMGGQTQLMFDTMLSAMPHVTKINSSFALREIIDRTALGLKPEMA